MLSENNFQHILVTGTSGLVGSHVADLLLARGYKVHLQYFSNKPAGDHPGASLVKMNLLQPVPELDRIDAVVHCAAEIPASFNDGNIDAVAAKNTVIDDHVISFCRKNSAKLIYFSSVSVYGSATFPWSENTAALPGNPYSEAKLDTEKRIAGELNDYLIYRISSPYGPGQRTKNVLLKFLESKVNSENIYLYSHGSRKQDFIFTGDIADAVLKGLTKTITGLFNIAHGKTISMQALADAVLSLEPPTGSTIVNLPGEDAQKDYDPVISIDKAKQLLNWQPNTSMQEGLKSMLLQHQDNS